MNNNNLTKPITLRLTSDQNKALDILIGKGFDRSKFIRLAIEEKLYKDFRLILKEIKEAEEKEELPF